jgi:molecular chaperone DnaK
MTGQIVSKGVGIDLGTTNSAVAVMNRTDTEVLIHRDTTTKSLTTPSCVWKAPNTGEIVVGRKAFRRVGTAPEPIRSVKRLMGHPGTVRLTDEDVAPEQVSAAILSEMKRQVEQDVAAWDTPSASWVVDRAIITVPAYFDHPNIEATRKAAELAGLEVLDLLHEPTAAACYHCWQTGTTNGTFLVYDLGGGTFDVSVVQCKAGAFEVLGISGNTRLGGDDIDTAVALRIQDQLIREGYALDLEPERDPEDRLRFNQLRFLAEGVKKALSTQTEFMVSDSGTLRDKNGEPVIIESMWERGEFESIARSVVERTIPYCDDAVKLATTRAGITLADVDEVILAGGSTHIPLVRELVTSELCASSGGSSGRPVRAKCAEPVYEKVDTVVALGAAIRASAVGGLATYDSRRRVRVSFRGTGASDTTTTRVGGKVEVLGQEDIDLDGGHVRLLTAEYEDETDLRRGGAFSFTGVPLQPGAETVLTFEVFDAEGTLVTTAGRPVSQETVSRPTGLSADTSQLAKAFLLEVDRGGKPYLKELIPALTHLPTSTDFTFSHPGDTELVLFSLYQRRRKIQVIEVPVPSTTPRGTPIRFNVEIDGLAMITVRGTIGSTEFDALVVQPPDRTMPAPDEITALERGFAEAVLYLPTGERALAEVKWTMAKDSFDAATARRDERLAVHEFEEMEALLADITGVDEPLNPPKQVFDQLVAQCRELCEFLRHGAAAGQPYDHAELSKSIDAQCDQGERAFRESDQRAYSEALVMLQGIYDHLVTIARQLLPPDNRSQAERITDTIDALRKDAARVAMVAGARGRPDFVEEIDGILRKLDELARDARRDPQRTLNKLGQLRARLEQINNILVGVHDTQGGKRPEDLPEGAS